jgi:hypothetical protein
MEDPRVLRSTRSFLVAWCLAGGLGAQTTLFELSGSQSFGWPLRTLGDLDGDGRSEFLVGASYEDNGTVSGAGAAYVFSGADAHVLYLVRGTGQGDHLGNAACLAGDVDADGVNDFAVGAQDDNVPGFRDGGSVQVFSGRDGRVLHTFRGQRVADYLGATLDSMGDLDRDGHDDLLVGVLGRLDPAGRWTGALVVYSGRDGSVLRTSYGQRVGSTLGLQDSWCLGDTDGDGFADYIGVDRGAIGYARLFSGADGRELRRHDVGNPNSMTLGRAPDMDHDGVSDYAVGLPGAGVSGAGEVQVFSGRTGALLHTFGGTRTSALDLGAHVGEIGDIDGDGYGELLASAGYSDGPTGTQCGAVRAFSGRDGHVVMTAYGAGPMEHLGVRDARGGHDVDGDGYPDVLTSSWNTPLLLVKVLSLRPRGLAPFGTGASGCAGALRLLANGVPTIGRVDFAFHVAGAGSDVTSLLMSDRAVPAGVPLYNALFHLDPARILTRTSLPGPDATGSIVAPLPIPADVTLLGLTRHFQAVSFFPAGTCARRIATTPGLSLTFQ